MENNKNRFPQTANECCCSHFAFIFFMFVFMLMSRRQILIFFSIFIILSAGNSLELISQIFVFFSCHLGVFADEEINRKQQQRQKGGAQKSLAVCISFTFPPSFDVIYILQSLCWEIHIFRLRCLIRKAEGWEGNHESFWTCHKQPRRKLPLPSCVTASSSSSRATFQHHRSPGCMNHLVIKLFAHIWNYRLSLCKLNLSHKDYRKLLRLQTTTLRRWWSGRNFHSINKQNALRSAFKNSERLRLTLFNYSSSWPEKKVLLSDSLNA